MKLAFGIAMVALFASPWIGAQFVILADVAADMAAIADNLANVGR